VTVATPPFRKILRAHVRTVPGNIPVKFEVRSFNRFGAISILHPNNKDNMVISIISIPMAAILDAILNSAKCSRVPGWHHSDSD